MERNKQALDSRSWQISIEVAFSMTDRMDGKRLH